ncbi:hypothetical protein BHE74_00033993, partial [Ensete ventricosum]
SNEVGFPRGIIACLKKERWHGLPSTAKIHTEDKEFTDQVKLVEHKRSTAFIHSFIRPFLSPLRPTRHTAEHTSPRVGMEFDLENPLTSCEDEQQRRDSISDLFAAESDHMIFTVGTIDLHARRNAVSLILQVKLYIEREKAIFFFFSHPFPSL